MKLLNILNRPVRIGIVVVLLFACIGFTGARQDARVCAQVLVQIDNQHNNFFVDEQDIRSLVGALGEGAIVGKALDKIDLKAAEAQLISNPYIDAAQVYKEIRGNLVAHVTLAKPIARIVGAEHRYLSDRGELLPFSKRFSPRVLLVSGTGTAALLQQTNMREESTDLFALLQYIYDNPFWRAQIAELSIDEQGEVVLYQQVGKQYIEFGKPTQIDTKFEKLAIFYEDILPRKGWNHYEKVNLKYENQIVCE